MKRILVGLVLAGGLACAKESPPAPMEPAPATNPYENPKPGEPGTAGMPPARARVNPEAMRKLMKAAVDAGPPDAGR